MANKESLNPALVVQFFNYGFSFKEITQKLPTEDAIDLAIGILSYYQKAAQYEKVLKFISELRSDDEFMANDSWSMKRLKHQLEGYEKRDRELLENK